MLKEFKQFLLRGNVIDLAVGVVVGAAFGAVVTSFVNNILTPFLGAVIRTPNFGNLSFTVHTSRIGYGSFLNALISFVLIAAAVFFFVVKPVNHLVNRLPQEIDEVDICPQCLSEINKGAKRCPHCTTQLHPHQD